MPMNIQEFIGRLETERDYSAEFEEYARRAEEAQLRIARRQRGRMRASRDDIRRALQNVVERDWMPEYFTTSKEPDWEL